VASKISSLRALMGSQADQKRLKPSIRRPVCNCVWCIWYEIPYGTFRINMPRKSPSMYVVSIRPRRKRKLNSNWNCLRKLRISTNWRNHWSHIILLFAFSAEIRKVIYTTNAIESVNMTLRKMTRNRRIFPSDESIFKVMYLAIQAVCIVFCLWQVRRSLTSCTTSNR
jgi:hypothetical protein